MDLHLFGETKKTREILEQLSVAEIQAAYLPNYKLNAIQLR
jgi:hypothetical protein